MNHLLKFILCIGVFLTGLLLSATKEIILQNGLDGYAGCSNASISHSGAPIKNQTDLVVAHTLGCCGELKSRILIHFDLSYLPLKAVIKEATLSLFITFNSQDVAAQPSFYCARKMRPVSKHIFKTWENCFNRKKRVGIC